MDKNKIIGSVLLVAAFGCLYVFSPRPTPAAAPVQPAAVSANAPAPDAPAGATPVATSIGNPTDSTSPAVALPAVALPAAPATMLAAVTTAPADAAVTTLANDFVEVRFTDFGGAIRDVALKQYPAVQGKDAPYVLNAQHAAPILAFTDFPGLDQNTRYVRVPSAAVNEIVYRTVLDGHIEVTRTYSLPAGGGDATHDPYRIGHTTTFRVLPGQPGARPLPVSLSLGTAAPVNERDLGQYLNVARFDGERANHFARTDLERGFLAGLGLSNNTEKSELPSDGPAIWGAVKNQFFASIYTPEKAGSGVLIRRVALAPAAGAAPAVVGITATMRLEVPALAPAPAAGGTLKGDLYVGPKEFIRLTKFSHSEDKVMQFDSNWYTRLFLGGYVAPFQNWLMNQMHRVVGNWGLAIVMMTLMLKFVSLPFTLAASRSAKRMQKIQPLMVALREKHKDNPQKLNAATMELFKEHKVNPVGSCLPVLITMPLFIGFFTMLQGTAELRFQPFLWASDLSGPDTIAHLLGFPINILPLLMGGTMFYQMRLTPTAPSVDDTQAMMMKVMPFFFTLICYNFSCALALYSTINGAFTIVQQLLVNKYAKVDDPELPGPGGKLIKNVTPKKK